MVADGVPLLWAARLLGTPLKERINGTDLFERTCQFAAERGYSVFLLGGSPGSATSASAELMRRHPTLKIVGLECPPMGFYKDDHQNKAIQSSIRTSGADILFVGLGAPQQEQWMCDYAAGSGVSFAIGVGVSFSFVRRPYSARTGLGCSATAWNGCGGWAKSLGDCGRDTCWKICHFLRCCCVRCSSEHWHVSKPRGDVAIFSYAPI